jgi:DNA-binding IclR family transcriptional regulator
LGVVLALNGVGKPTRLEDLARDPCYRNRRISQSVVRSLLVLSAFASGAAFGVNSLAEELGIGSTTLWRYLKTWAELGVLEEREDRRYQIARHWMVYLPKTARHGQHVRA